MPKVRKSRLSRNKKILIAISVILTSGLIFLVLEKAQITNFYTVDTISTEEDAQTTSVQPSAQSDFADGDDREPGNTVREDEGSASITDNSGSIESYLDQSNPITSSTGEITLFSPRENAQVEKQVTIAGTSTLSSVSYRVIDSISGVVDRGELKVVNGRFSGTLNIDTNASEGRLDIFGLQANGNEFSNIAIPLRFR